MAGYSWRPSFSPGTQGGPGAFLIIIVAFKDARAPSLLYAPLHTLSLPTIEEKSIPATQEKRNKRYEREQAI